MFPLLEKISIYYKKYNYYKKNNDNIKLKIRIFSDIIKLIYFKIFNIF